MKKLKFTAWLQIIFQFFVPLISALPGNNLYAAQRQDNASVSADSQQTVPETVTDAPWSSTLSTAASALSNQNAVATATSAATGYGSTSAQRWLSQFGTARVQINVDDNGNWDDSALDFLAPLYDDRQALLFTQVGLRAPDGRTTGNVGMGVRTFHTPDWMFGVNVFFDDDMKGNNRRVGIGGEAWTDYLKLSANSYLATSNWHTSQDFADYDEKPADGFDVRAEGYLPAYPQLGAKLMYEQYYGDKVALFDKDDLQSDPSAVTVGLNYTPVPLVSMSMDYKRGQDSMDEMQFGVNFRYSIGQKWSEQISVSQVAELRTLQGSRYDLVERNNEIVLQYKKKADNSTLTDMTILSEKDNSPADGASANLVSVRAVTSDGKPARNAVINWTITGQGRLSSPSGVTDDNGYAAVSVTDTSPEAVMVQATSGNVTRSTQSHFTQFVATLELQITQDNSPADGKAQNAGRVTVKDASGAVMPGQPIAWKVDNGAAISDSDTTTDSNGGASVRFTSTQPGPARLTASTGGKTQTRTATFIDATPQPGKVSIAMTVNGAPADGRSTDEATATVTDAAGKPAPGVNVVFALNDKEGTAGSAKPSGNTSAVTDNNGQATIKLTDTEADTRVTVGVKAQWQSATTLASFSPVPAGRVVVTVPVNNAIADGMATDEAQAVVTDTTGKPMAGIPVTFSVADGGQAANSARISGDATVTTDVSGMAFIKLTDTEDDGGVTVTASAGGQTGSAQAAFHYPPFGPVTLEVEHATSMMGDVINQNVAIDGVSVTVNPYSGMMAGDVIALDWQITGNAGSGSRPPSEGAYQTTHTVTAAEVGAAIEFVVPASNAWGFQGENNNLYSLMATTTITATNSRKQQTSVNKTYVIDTVAPG